MELLLGCFFNSVWIISSFAFGWLLFKLFAFVPLPGWLEMSIIIALSFFAGLTVTTTLAGKSVGENRAQRREGFKALLLISTPTVAACVVAVVCYFLTHKFNLAAEVEKYVVSGVTLTFWFTVMSIFTKRLEAQIKKDKK